MSLAARLDGAFVTVRSRPMENESVDWGEVVMEWARRIQGWAAAALLAIAPGLGGAAEPAEVFGDASLATPCPVVPVTLTDCELFENHPSLLTSPTLTGDWGGLRTDLAAAGIVFQADATQFYFGNTTGGVDREFRYGGHNDYVLIADGGKLGVHEGLVLKLRAEHRYGESISTATGAILPATVLADLPVNGSEDLYLTNVLFTQVLDEHWAVFAGKTDTLDGDPNDFAHGRGKTQFSNVAFVANPILLRSVPYSTLTAGVSYLYEGQPLLTATILNASDTTRTSGFEELFADGAVLTAEARIPTQFFGKPGHQVFGGAWSSKDFVSLGQDPRFILGDVPIARRSGTWGLYYNFDQYLVTSAKDPKRGWGVFGRAGIGDQDVNPLEYFLSAGVGGSSPLESRPHDTFGVGWYYLGASSELGPLLSNLGDGQGVELFYNYQVTPWFHVTPDLQVIMPGRQNIDTSLVVGVRANIAL